MAATLSRTTTAGASLTRPLAATGLELTRALVGALAVAGLTELLLLRVLSRVGIHIPKSPAVQRAYELLTGLGSFAFDLATVLAFLAAAALALLLLVSGRRLLGLLLGQFAAVSLAMALGAPGVSARAVYALLAISVLGVALGAAARSQPGRHTLALAAIVAAYAAALYWTLAYQLPAAVESSSRLPGATLALGLAEGLVPVAAVLAFWAWGGRRQPPRRAALLVSLAVVVVVGGSFAENASTSAILALWTLGLTLYLPLPLYAGALVLYALTVNSCLRRPEARTIGVALLLLLVAGLNLETTYQSLVAALAVSLLASSSLFDRQRPM